MGRKELIKKEIDLSGLPRWGNGKNKGNISWFNTIGYNVRFIYDDIEGNIRIIGYESKKQELIILYDNKEFKIRTSLFVSCQIGRIIGKVTKEFKYDIGTIFKDNKRYITIIDREYRNDKNNCDRKWYKYKCLECGWDEGWIIEGHIDEGNGCSCCANRTPVLGINTIWDTDKWMIPIVGEEFAKTHTHSCSDKIHPICPDCGRVKSKKMTINTIYGKHRVPCICSDNFSYPEKAMFNILEQLEVKFNYHKTFNWSENKEYDFNIFDEIIIETHGEQHYKDGKFSTIKGARNVKEEQANDELKKELALSNGIKEENYIVIDCRYTYLNWIKEHVLESNLNKLFDLNKIDWNKVEEFACSNLVKVACKYKRNNAEMTTGTIAKIMNISQGTVIRFLKTGSNLGWCLYDVAEEKRKTGEKCSFANCKKVKCIELNKTFNSLKECSQYFKENLNIRLISSNIGVVCNNKIESYKGYHFEFVNQEKDNKMLKAI